jgi:hypothetical protein
VRSRETPYRYAQFDGLRNDVAPDEFNRTDLVEALNVDIDNAKRIARRSGFGAPIVGGACHSVWADTDFCLVVSSTSLLRIFPDLSSRVVRTGLTDGARVSYSRIKDRVYWSNGHETGVIEAARSSSRSWGLAVPVLPTATASFGSLAPGRYLFSTVYLRSDGQESGAPTPSFIDLPIGGGIVFSLFPASADSDIVGTILFVSKANGEELYYVGTIFNGITSFQYSAQGPATQRLNTLYLQPAPAGQIIFTFRGRAYVAVDNFLFYSTAHGYELFDLEDYIQFEDRITIGAPMTDGVFIGTTSEHIFLGGLGPDDFQFRSIASYGAIPGTLAYGTADDLDPKSGLNNVAFWTSERGLCSGQDGGVMTNLTIERYAIPATERGAGVVRRAEGLNQYLAILQGAEKQANSYQ